MKRQIKGCEKGRKGTEGRKVGNGRKARRERKEGWMDGQKDR